MQDTVGVFVGSSTSFNVRIAASNIGRALSSDFNVDLISTDAAFSAGLSEYFNKVHRQHTGGDICTEIRTLHSYITSNSPDILFQITNPPIHGTIVGVLSKLYGINSIYRYSGDRFNVHKLSNITNKIPHYTLNNIVGRIPIKSSDNFVAMGPYGRRQLEKHGANKDKVSIIPPSINEDRFINRTVEQISDKRIGLFVGRISRRKGKDTLERTIPKIIDKREDIQFIFVGEEVDKLELPRDLDDHIKKVGPVSPNHMGKYYNMADFLIHPSLIEGLPRVVLEALVNGVTPIARDVGDIRFATSNVFKTDKEFIDMVINFENLSSDPADRFLFKNVREEYIKLMNRVLK